MDASPIVPLVIRGEVLESKLREFRGRSAGTGFRAPDVAEHLQQLILANPALLSDVHALSCADVVGYLAALGQRLVPHKNRHLQKAFEVARETSGLPDTVLKKLYAQIPEHFDAARLRALLDRQIGEAYLEGWVEQPAVASTDHRIRIRAFGARSVHIVAGNIPTISALSVVRNALVRSDAIIKAPSNDPLTAVAIARTMAEMDASHPLTAHLSVAYWKGGDARIERLLYTPHAVDKIVAWGGASSISHIKSHLHPGIDLITFEAKHGRAIIGAEAFAGDETLDRVATLLARDIGALNQEACFSCRVAYVDCKSAGGVDGANELGRRTFEAMQRLPRELSEPRRIPDPELTMEIVAAGLTRQEFRVYGGAGAEGTIIVSQTSSPVDFAHRLTGRVANIVPIGDTRKAVRAMNASAQTVSVYPETLQRLLRDQLAYHGVQRVVSLGAAATDAAVPVPQDGMEPLRRMCRWIVEEETDPEPQTVVRGV